MLKRILFALLVTTLVFGLSTCALADEDELLLSINTQVVKTYLDANELNYTQMGENDDVFKLDYSLDGTLNSGVLWIIVYDDGVQFEADYDISANEDKLGEVAQFLCGVNAKMRIGGFYIEDGSTIGNSAFYYTGNLAPSQEGHELYLLIALNNLETYSDSIASILFGSETASALLAE